MWLKCSKDVLRSDLSKSFTYDLYTGLLCGCQRTNYWISLTYMLKLIYQERLILILASSVVHHISFCTAHCPSYKHLCSPCKWSTENYTSRIQIVAGWTKPSSLRSIYVHFPGHKWEGRATLFCPSFISNQFKLPHLVFLSGETKNIKIKLRIPACVLLFHPRGYHFRSSFFKWWRTDSQTSSPRACAVIDVKTDLLV